MGAPNAAPRAAEVQNRARSRATASAASIPAGRRATTTRRGQADGRRGVSEGGDDGQQLQHPPSRGADGGRARGREADSGAGRPPRRAEGQGRRGRRGWRGRTPGRAGTAGSATTAAGQAAGGSATGGSATAEASVTGGRPAPRPAEMRTTARMSADGEDGGEKPRRRPADGGGPRWPGRGRRKGKKIGIAALCCCDSIYGFGATGDPVPGREDRSSRGRYSGDE